MPDDNPVGMSEVALFVREDAPDLYDGLTSGLGLAVVIGSAPAGVVTIALLFQGRFGPARLTSALAVGAIIVGLAVAQSPDPLPGVLTVSDAAASEPTWRLGTTIRWPLL